jgi:uncharacterized protein YecE (DUF72 family)
MGKVHVGTMGWSYDFWVGNLYSKEAKTDEYLTEYAQHFDSVEVDSTFYRIPSEATVRKWFDQTPSGFIFSLKFPRVITHIKMLKDCQPETEAFFRHISRLGSKLGPLLLQFSYAFGKNHVSSLEEFLANLPQKHRIAVEVRNKGLLNDEFYSLLRRREVALAWVDSPFMPKLEVITADFAYIRWEGDRRKVNGLLGKVETDRVGDIEAWAGKVRRLLDDSMEVYGYFSKYYSGYPPTDAGQLLGLMQK